MNLFFRILVALYSLMLTVVFGFIMISPFGNKELMSMVLDYLNITCYQSKQYDIAIFLIGFVFFVLNIIEFFFLIFQRPAPFFIKTFIN